MTAVKGKRTKTNASQTKQGRCWRRSNSGKMRKGREAMERGREDS
jgi:hypothetical protein